MNQKGACVFGSLLLFCLVLATNPTAATLTVVAGGGLGDGLPATLASIEAGDVAVAGNGDQYLIDPRYRLVWRIDSETGIAQCIAGGGDPREGCLSGVHSGDGGPASMAVFDHDLSRISVDAAGNVFVVSTSRIVRKIHAETGIITTILDLDNKVGIPSGGPEVESIADVAVSEAGDIYFSEANYLANTHRIWRIDPGTGAIVPVAGTATGSGFSGDGGPATEAQLNAPTSICLDHREGLLVVDAYNNRIRRVDLGSDEIQTLFGWDGFTATLNDVGVDSSGNVYVYGSRTEENRPHYSVWRIDAVSGEVDILAERDEYSDEDAVRWGGLWFGVGPGGTAFVAAWEDGVGYSYNAGPVYAIDAATGEIAPAVGTSHGDGARATDSHIDPLDIHIGPSGDLYIAELRRILKVDSTGTMATFAGGGHITWGVGDNGPATQAVVGPKGLSGDRAGNLYFSQGDGVRRVDTSGMITTIAGLSHGYNTKGFEGDGGSATDARLFSPLGLCTDSAGNLYISDSQNNRVRRIDTATGTITTVAGNGEQGEFEDCDGVPATEAPISVVQRVWMSSAGQLYIASYAGLFLLDLETGVLDGIQPDWGVYPDASGGGLYRASDPFSDSRITRVDGEAGETSVLLDGSSYEAAPFPGWGCQGVGDEAYLGHVVAMGMDEAGNLYIANEWDRTNGVPGRVMKLGLAPPPPRSTDFNSDGRVDFDDFLEFVSVFGKRTGQEGFDDRFDLDGDGRVRFEDFLLFVADFGN